MIVIEKVGPSLEQVNMVLQLALIGTALVQPALEIEDTYSCIPILRYVLQHGLVSDCSLNDCK